MNITNLKSALVSAVLMAILAVLAFIVQQGSIFGLNVQQVANVFVISLFTAIVSFVKNSFTSPVGTFAGIKVR